MAAIRANITVEVDQKGNGLLIQTPVNLQLVHEQSQWHAECESPFVHTDPCETMEEAIIAGATQAGVELQTAVIERPLIVGKITPDSVSSMFT